jgi:hypothetical protein
MNCRAKVFSIPIAALAPILRGEKRIANLPPDAVITAADYGLLGLGVRVHSESFEEVPLRKQLPVVPAVLERRV